MMERQDRRKDRLDNDGRPERGQRENKQKRINFGKRNLVGEKNQRKGGRKTAGNMRESGDSSAGAGQKKNSGPHEKGRGLG